MSSFQIVGKKQEVDPCYGLYDLYIDRDDIEALLSGKKLYSTISFDEYAITIEMEEKDIPSIHKEAGNDNNEV